MRRSLPERPFFRLAISRSLTRSMARLTASTMSKSPTSSGPCVLSALVPAMYSLRAASMTMAIGPCGLICDRLRAAFRS